MRTVTLWNARGEESLFITDPPSLQLEEVDALLLSHPPLLLPPRPARSCPLRRFPGVFEGMNLATETFDSHASVELPNLAFHDEA